MKDLFYYNWQIRQDWFGWCADVSFEELRKERIGGMGSFLHNLFHVIDCEQIWINRMNDSSILQVDEKDLSTLQEVINYSDNTQKLSKEFFRNWSEDFGKAKLNITRRSGEELTLSYEQIIKHIATHEVHHIGQLSIWAREMGVKPVSSDLIFRKLK
ncbi:DinB family protein [Bacillus sp. 2205SS5-2]|uniref:DinB family protein n=1 Tax=Bacillus sp. 2205SS5-2 TaxID=3109031 RepID=UPI003006C71A